MVIHCVIMNPVTPASLKLVQYLIKVYPSVLDAKSIAGYTPLWLAFKLCRAEYAKLLIEAGADQQAKDTVYSNIVHAALQHLPRPSQLRALLELLDPTARRELLLQRNSLSAAGGTTPLHLFVTKYRKTKEPPKTYYGTPGTSTYDCKPSSAAEIVSLLLSYSSGAELEMLDGAGDTVLHALVSAEWPGAIRAVLDTNPTLLFRENAVGRTPLEVGQARLEAARFTVPEWPGDAQSTYYYNSRNQSRTPQMARFLRRLGAAPERGQSATGRPYRANALRKASPKLFVATSHDDSDDEEDDKDHEQANAIFAGPEATWKVLAAYARRAAAADPAACRRRLVSLNEANDVARRLGETYAKSRYFTGKKRREDGDDDEEGSEAAENEDGAEKKKGESDEADIKKEIEKDGCVVDRYLSSDFGVILPRTKEEREKPCELCGKVHD